MCSPSVMWSFSPTSQESGRHPWPGERVVASLAGQLDALPLPAQYDAIRLPVDHPVCRCVAGIDTSSQRQLFLGIQQGALERLWLRGKHGCFPWAVLESGVLKGACSESLSSTVGSACAGWGWRISSRIKPE